MVVLVLDDIRFPQLGPPCLPWHRLAHQLQIELKLVEQTAPRVPLASPVPLA